MSSVNFCGVPNEAVPAVKSTVANATERVVAKPEIKSFPDMVAEKVQNPQVKEKVENAYTSPFAPYNYDKLQEANSVLAKAAAEKTYNAPPVP